MKTKMKATITDYEFARMLKSTDKEMHTMAKELLRINFFRNISKSLNEYDIHLPKDDIFAIVDKNTDKYIEQVLKDYQ